MDIETIKNKFWALSTQEALTELNTQKEGLSKEQVNSRKQQFGPNELKDDGRVSPFRIFLNQFKSPLIFILIIAGVVTVLEQQWIDAGVIFLAVFVNAALGFYQENRAEEAIEHLRSYIKQRTRVIRGGKEFEIDVKEVVPGDIVRLVSGDRVPADARILTVNDLTVDEAILTGESLPIDKNTEELAQSTELAERRNMAFGGTQVVGGSALAVVTATGEYTEIGRIAELVAGTKREKTPLQRSVNKLAWVIAGALTFLIGAVFAFGVFARGISVEEMFLVAVAMAVSAIPEALPISLTVILAVGVEQLAKRKGVVRKLSAAESLGSTTTIITDKTGTLTEAKMRLAGISTLEELLKGKNQINPEKEEISKEHESILRASLFNSDVVVENPEEVPKNWRLVGPPLERNLVKEAAEYGISILELRDHVTYSETIPFSSEHKFSASFVSADRDIKLDLENENFLSVLGAPDVLLKRSNMDKDEYLKALETVDNLADQGKRLLGYAVKPVSGREEAEEMEPEDIKDLQFVGLIAFYDPVRPEVHDAMKRVESMGVSVVMATGDLQGTALAVARELGWNVTERNVLTGTDIKKMSDKDLIRDLDHVRIFARVSPEDKVRIAKLYKEKGEIVAMTGDGVNDAPSLKAVDIGVAVGSGTDVAKDVADLVLLDDNFETIGAAVEEGRRILSNIKKSVIYLMSDALNEVFLIGGALLAGLPLPLTALQILWVNFFSDSLPALTFAFEKHYDKSVQKPGKGKNRLLDSEVKLMILGIGTVVSALLFAMYWFLLRHGFDTGLVRTFIFVSFGVYTIFLAFPLRSLKQSLLQYNPFSNKWMNLAVLFGVILMAAAVYVPFLNNVLDTSPLPPLWVAGLIGWVGVNIFAVELTKKLFRKRNSSTSANRLKDKEDKS